MHKTKTKALEYSFGIVLMMNENLRQWDPSTALENRDRTFADSKEPAFLCLKTIVEILSKKVINL